MKGKPNAGTEGRGTPCETPYVSPDAAGQPSVDVAGLSLVLSGKIILRDVSFRLPARGMNVLIGPSGAGKSTLLRCLNRLHDGWTGQVRVLGRDPRRWPRGEDELRRRVGLIAQRPAVFPCSVRDNVIFGMRSSERRRCDGQWVQRCLTRAALWEEVRDRLREPAARLSAGQRQRLCVARALALRPSVLLLDEPTSSLDPRSKQMIEESLLGLARTIPLLCVTHDMDQAMRLGGQVIFMCDGRIIEAGTGERMLRHPERIETREFLRWSVCDCD